MVTAVMSFLMTNTFERGGRFAADTKHLPPRLHTMASVRVAFWGGVVLRARALGAPVAGWALASAVTMTPAIPVEFGLYSCV